MLWDVRSKIDENIWYVTVSTVLCWVQLFVSIQLGVAWQKQHTYCIEMGNTFKNLMRLFYILESRKEIFPSTLDTRLKCETKRKGGHTYGRRWICPCCLWPDEHEVEGPALLTRLLPVLWDITWRKKRIEFAPNMSLCCCLFILHAMSIYITFHICTVHSESIQTSL